MSTKVELLKILGDNQGGYFSGEELAEKIGVTRNSVWKGINSLRAEGYDIESKVGTGYRLMSSSDIISETVICDGINYPSKVTVLDKVDSTNNYAKKLTDMSKINVIVANEQTSGRGRMGRDFYSPSSKGIYMTVCFEPKFGVDKAMLVTGLSALAICKAFEETCGVGPKIKWVNDLYLEGKKVCGVLTEAETNFESGKITKMIIGIGINCFEQEFPEELEKKATYIRNSKKEFDRNKLIVAIVNKLFEHFENIGSRGYLMEYKARSFILGEQISIYGTATKDLPENGGRGIKARAVDIDDNGGLVVEYLEGQHMRELATIMSGEVTIRKTRD